MAELSDQSLSGWGKFISPFIDCLTLAAYVYFLPWLAQSYLTPSTLNGVIVGLAFIALLIAIRALKELAHSKKNATMENSVTSPPSVKDARISAKKEDAGCWSPKFLTLCLWFIYCGFLAIVFLQTATSYDLNSNDGEMAGAGLMFFGSMAVLIVLALPTAGTTKPGSLGNNFLHGLSVIGIALVTIVGMALWESLKLADPGTSTEQFHGIWKLIMFLLMLLVFIGFLGLPRIYLHMIKGDKLGLATYIGSLGYYVWNLFGF